MHAPLCHLLLSAKLWSATTIVQQQQQQQQQRRQPNLQPMTMQHRQRATIPFCHQHQSRHRVDCGSTWQRLATWQCLIPPKLISTALFNMIKTSCPLLIYQHWVAMIMTVLQGNLFPYPMHRHQGDIWIYSSWPWKRVVQNGVTMQTCMYTLLFMLYACADYVW